MHGSTVHLKRISLESDTVRLSGTPQWPSEPFAYYGDLVLSASHEELAQLIGGSSFTVIESWSDGVHATIYPPPPPELAQAFLSACLDEAERGASN